MADIHRTRTFTWQDPAPLHDAASRLSGLELLKAIGSGELPAPPMMQTLGIEPVDVETGRAVFAVEPRENHLNPLGVAHGGLAVSLLDTAMGCAVHSHLEAGARYLTLELKVNFARPLVPGMGRVTCEGTTLHVGSRVAIAEAKVLDGKGRLCAHATSTCLILRKD